MSKALIVPGHYLVAEGAAFEDPYGTGTFNYRVRGNSVSGRGVGKCSCGERSEVLDSGAQRRLWHRDHKNDILGEQVLEEIRECGGSIEEWRRRYP